MNHCRDGEVSPDCMPALSILKAVNGVLSRIFIMSGLYSSGISPEKRPRYGQT